MQLFQQGKDSIIVFGLLLVKNKVSKSCCIII